MPPTDAGKSVGVRVPSGSTVTTLGGDRYTVDAVCVQQRHSDGSTPAGRAFAEAEKFERKARQVSDPTTAAGYRELAKARYAEAGVSQ
jgi:hypothetical protein